MKNKKLLFGVALAVIAGLLLYKNVQADIGGVIDVEYVTDHLFRGEVRANDSVQGTVSTAVSVGDDLVLDVKGLYSVATDGDYQEFDASVGSTFELNEELSLTVGSVLYEFINVDRDTDIELFAGVSLTEVFLTPTITLFHNIETDVNTVQLSVGNTWQVGSVDVNVSGVAGDGVDKYYGGRVGARYGITDELFVNASVTLLRNDTTGENNEAFGVGVSYIF